MRAGACGGGQVGGQYVGDLRVCGRCVGWAMIRWLVLDNAYTCSASVLDRLNCLREEGGQLVVSERGVLWGQVVTVPDTALS